MSDSFRHQMADYADYHRDPWNCAMHVFGILSLFLAAVVLLSLVTVPLLGLDAPLAALLALPALLYWLWLDAAIGLGIVIAAAVLLGLAGTIVASLDVVWVWALTVGLVVIGVAFQLVGHRVFERRQPALVDNPTHLMLGPMFVMAKLFIALGFRRDLAVLLQPAAR